MFVQNRLYFQRQCCCASNENTLSSILRGTIKVKNA